MTAGLASDAHFLAVVGPSGSGKSSVVRAGLVPALRRGGMANSHRWFVVELIPGAQPLEELEAALLRVAVNPPEQLLAQLQTDERGLLRAVKRVLPADEQIELVLIVDQFEELFTLVEDEAVRAHFLDSLQTAVSDPRSRLRLVITLRADFYDRPLRYSGFGELMRERTEVVLPLTRAELEQAIVRPAARVGVTVAPDLLSAIVQDVGAQPGVLPLLQYALTELFEQRDGRTLTLATYRASGGVLGTLARRADELYDGLSTAQQGAARQLFLRLITLGEGTEDTRRRVRRDELTYIGRADDPAAVLLDQGGSEAAVPATLLVPSIDDSALLARRLEQRSTLEGDGAATLESAALEGVLSVYGRARLLTFDHDPITRLPTVEVAHEALIRTWGRLRGWLESGREQLRVQRRLTQAAAEWAASGQDPSFLAHGARLAQFNLLAAEGTLVLNAAERNFLAASRDRAEVARQREQRRAEEQARSARRLRAMVIVLALVSFLAIGTALYANSERNRANQQAHLATSRQLAAQARNLFGDQFDLALLLALEASRIGDLVEVKSSLVTGLVSSPHIDQFLHGHSETTRGECSVVRTKSYAPHPTLMTLKGVG